MTVTNPYYEFDPTFTPGTKARSEEVNFQYQSIQNAFDFLPGDADAITTGTSTFAPETGAGNAYVVTMPDTRTSNTDGDEVVFFSTHANTGAATIDVDGIGAVAIVDHEGNALVANDILNSICYIVRYDATNTRFQLTSPKADYETAAAASAAAAAVSETNAAASAVEAMQWAVHPEDDDVDSAPGQFSAFHWAQKALGAATIQTIVGDINTATPPTSEAVIALLQYEDADQTDVLGNIGFAGANFLRIRNNMQGGSIGFVQEDSAGTGLTGLTISTPSAGVSQVILPSIASPTTPTLAFGDGDTGWYEIANDQVGFAIAGAAKWNYIGNRFEANGTNGPGMLNESVSATNPTLIPQRSDFDTGIGRAAVDQLSLIAGGLEMMRLVESGVSTSDQIIIGPAGVIGSATTPSLAWGDGNTGLYESADNTLWMSVNGAARYAWSGATYQGSNGVALNNVAASATVPVLLPQISDSDTGIGWVTGDQLALIAGGVSVMHLGTAGPRMFTDTNAPAGPAGQVGTGAFEIYDLDNSHRMAAFGFYGSTNGNLRFRNDVHEGHVELTGQNTAGTEVFILSGDPDGTASLYAVGNERLAARTSGIVGILSDGDTDTENRLITGYHSDLTARWQLGQPSVADAYFRNFIHGGRIILDAEQTAAGLTRRSFQGDPDGATTIYGHTNVVIRGEMTAEATGVVMINAVGGGAVELNYDGVKSFETKSEGIIVSHNTGDTFAITLTGTAVTLAADNSSTVNFEGAGSGGGYNFDQTVSIRGSTFLRVFDAGDDDHIFIAHEATYAEIGSAGTGVGSVPIRINEAVFHEGYSVENDVVALADTNLVVLWTAGNSAEVDLENWTANRTITLTGAPVSGDYGVIEVKVTQDGTSARTITWAGGTFVWVNDTAHVQNPTLNGISIYVFETWDGGTTWYAAGADYGA